MTLNGTPGRNDEVVREDTFNISSNTYSRIEYRDGNYDYKLNGKACRSTILIRHVERHYQHNVKDKQ